MAAETGRLKDQEMNTQKKNPAVIITFIAAACLIHILLFRGKVNMEISIIRRLLSAVAAIAVTLPLHESIHWLLMKAFGLKDARIELAIDPAGLPSLRTTASGQLTKIRRRIVLLAPFFILTLLPDVIFCMADRIELFFLIAAICNAAGCCFDIMDAVNTR